MREPALLDKYRDKKVLITGNTGFKGSWLSIWLLELGAEVYGYALQPQHKNDNFLTCDLKSKVHQTYADIRDAEKLKLHIEKTQPDYIFHLAAQALVIDSYANPLQTYETNVMGTANLLEAARSVKSIKSIVLITSDKCYENKEQVWGYRENDQLGGKDPYSSSKASAELVIRSFQASFFQKSPTSLVSVRAGNVIGGGDWSKNRLIPDIFKSIEEGKEFKIRNPQATRPWEHILEPLSGYLQLGILAGEEKKWEGPYNFGPSTYRHYNVLEVVEEIARWADFSFAVENKKQGYPEANLLQLDITKAANKLNWLPQLDFSKTIQFTVEGYLSKENKFDAYTQQIREYTNLAMNNKTNWAL